MTLDEFRKSRKLTIDLRTRCWVNTYARNWVIVEDADGYSTGVEEFDTLEEAEKALFQMYCDEDRLTEGY